MLQCNGLCLGLGRGAELASADDDDVEMIGAGLAITSATDALAQ